MQIRAMKKQTQNKPNLLDAQMNISSVLTKDYERNDIFAVPENKANSNPIPQRDTQYAIRDTRYKPNQTQSPSAIRNTQYEIRDTNPIPQPPFLPQKPTLPRKISRKILFPAKSR